MYRPLLAAAYALLCATLPAQTTLYVTPAGTGDGRSWQTASDLHVALSRARPGDEVWVAGGQYATSATDNREASFHLPDGVSLLGGFRGDEPTRDARDPTGHPTVLTGEIGGPGRDDNAYTILRLSGASDRTRVEGITFRGAYANGAGPVADPRRAGGAVLISGGRDRGASAPVFTACRFEDNYARDGGAVYIAASGGRATPRFVECAFRQNVADLDGGAVYIDGRHGGDASPTFDDCVFEDNEANYGGAIFNQSTKGTTNPRLSGCAFVNNHAYVRGASLYNIDHRGTSRPVLLSCRFEGAPPQPAPASADDLARGF